MSARYRFSTRFSFRDPMLFGARARLAECWLELSGWHWHRRYRRQIDLDRIVHVDVTGDTGLILWLVDGEVVRLSVEQPEVWKAKLTDVCLSGRKSST